MQETGSIVKKAFGAGSKSEHDGVFLVTPEREYVLRRRGGNPFRDPELEKLVGKKVRAEGSVLGDYTFLLSNIEVLPNL
ncbi:MAG: hypothetical protein C5B50_05765 [Verrucomicrobia bacterium]|nr:MAG: hypothetical protein C5B50_05765 [Verrucomicrobiota bacterium]